MYLGLDSNTYHHFKVHTHFKLQTGVDPGGHGPPDHQK